VIIIRGVGEGEDGKKRRAEGGEIIRRRLDWDRGGDLEVRGFLVQEKGGGGREAGRRLRGGGEGKLGEKEKGQKKTGEIKGPDCGKPGFSTHRPSPGVAEALRSSGFTGGRLFFKSIQRVNLEKDITKIESQLQ
jgi:hypothetical protein